MTKMYKIFVSYAFADKHGNTGFGDYVINSDIYPLTASKLTEIVDSIIKKR